LKFKNLKKIKTGLVENPPRAAPPDGSLAEFYMPVVRASFLFTISALLTNQAHIVVEYENYV
jgi:hypothetical protein